MYGVMEATTMISLAGVLLVGGGAALAFLKSSWTTEAMAKNMERRLDTQDRTMGTITHTLTGVQMDVAKIKGKLDMNGH